MIKDGKMIKWLLGRNSLKNEPTIMLDSAFQMKIERTKSENTPLFLLFLYFSIF